MRRNSETLQQLTLVKVVILFPLVKSNVTVLTLFVGTQTCRHTILLYLCVATDHLVWFCFSAASVL